MPQSILVVDDDLDTLALIGLTLQRRGFAVRKAQSGSEALEMLRAELSDLVIADVMMPQMDGYEVCRQIKTDPRTAHLPVVMLTAKAQTASQLEGFRAGAIDYITKPVHPQDLVTRITSVLERAKAPTTQVRTNVIAVAGAKGGVGATTLAVNLATVSASHARTILVDLEMSGTAHLHLGLEPQHGLDDLGKLESGPNDPSTIDAVLTQHAAGLRLLASSETAIEPARVGLILNQAVALCDVCVLDLGWGVSQLTGVVAQRSTAFVIALDSDRAALTQANRLLHALSESNVPPSAVKLVWINRQNLPPEVGRGSIRAVLGRDPDVTIDSAAELLYEALEKGQPLVLSHPDSPTAAQVRQLAETVLIRIT